MRIFDSTAAASLADGVASLTADDGVWPRQKFFAAKRAEEEQRRARYNDTAYNLEPNVRA